MTTRWLRCEVHSGMFTDERVVRIEMANGRALSAFVPASEVEEENGSGDGRVRVRFVSTADGCWVMLPAEDPNPVPVRELDLVR